MPDSLPTDSSRILSLQPCSRANLIGTGRSGRLGGNFNTQTNLILQQQQFEELFHPFDERQSKNGVTVPKKSNSFYVDSRMDRR
jgi:hypothetical protein